MNRNQKIALGCGGAGCLGLVVVLIAAGLIYFFAWRSPSRHTDYGFNVSTNRNSNSNDNSDFTANTNDNSSNSNSSSSSSTMSDDDKHKLYEAARRTSDAELIRRVSVKIGVLDEDYTPGEDYENFIEEHVGWILSNTDFIETINTAEKARAYIQTHLPN